ncbi:hypothetical protein OIU84_029011 [Salix udensis]|uniref:Uncharacterized protein n=1 Tax=Salix udensis TaxID=889485 RepID=A0AAD6PAT5_9ROSI|nr:hypothetical protein OIU84_029011 [Salix udensis]
MHLTIWNLIVMLYVTVYINEVLELILLAIKDDSSKDAGGDHPSWSVNNVDFTSRKDPSLNNQRTGKTLAKIDDHIETYLNYNSHQQELMQPHPRGVGTDIRGGNPAEERSSCT